jgi:cell division protein FtsI/penicillin-binding protein 2
MTSFGSGISLTPLELSALLSAIANGGTLYYLQYPRTQSATDQFVPRVKRKLEIGSSISEVKFGMKASVDYGTGRRAAYDPGQPLLGKTGTCTDYRGGATHLGWFGSFNDFGRSKLVVVVLLTGGRSVNGPVAAGVAGGVFKNLAQQNFFDHGRPISPAALVSVQSCCRQ